MREAAAKKADGSGASDAAGFGMDDEDDLDADAMQARAASSMAATVHGACRHVMVRAT